VVAAQAGRFVVAGAKAAWKNPLVRTAVMTGGSKVVKLASDRIPDVYRSRSPIIAVTGLAGTGKTVLIHRMCAPNSTDMPYERGSVLVEKRSTRMGTYGMRFRIIPGGDVAGRAPGLRQHFHDDPVDGVIHVVADGLASLRPDDPNGVPIDADLDTYRARQRENEVIDFRDTAVHIASLVSASTRPIWLLVAVTKTDLLHPDMAADIVANYYSAGGHSPFADELRLLRRKVGEGRLTTSTMPVYAVAEDFTYRGETVPTRGSDGDRDARLEEFRTRLRHLTGQIT
jgi:hypothetical protein